MLSETTYKLATFAVIFAVFLRAGMLVFSTSAVRLHLLFTSKEYHILTHLKGKENYGSQLLIKFITETLYVCEEFRSITCRKEREKLSGETKNIVGNEI